jgi:hypothetical protein
MKPPGETVSKVNSVFSTLKAGDRILFNAVINFMALSTHNKRNLRHSYNNWSIWHRRKTYDYGLLPLDIVDE